MKKISENRKKNRGSTIVEMTLLMPVFLGCVYFFILFFLFFIDSGKKMSEMCEALYDVEAGENRKSADNGIRKEGNVLKIVYTEEGKWFDYDLTLRRNGNDVVKNIRRWQLAADTF